jgi:hypothetical protein
LVIESDTHAGHRLGLMNPSVTLYDEDPITGEPVPYTPASTAAQSYLWRLRTKALETVDRLTDAAGEWVYLHNGDETQGNKYKDELITSRQSDQGMIAASNMQPVYSRNPSSARFSAGTGAHDFGEGSSTQTLCKLLQAEYPNVSTKSVNHGLMTVGGMAVDYAHHGPPPGARSWLRGNVARFYLRDLMLGEIVAGRTPPRLVVRSHYHETVIEDVRVGKYLSTIVITPSMCLLGNHGRQATRSTPRVINGILAVEIVDGDIAKLHELTNVVDIRIKEVIGGITVE